MQQLEYYMLQIIDNRFRKQAVVFETPWMSTSQLMERKMKKKKKVNERTQTANRQNGSQYTENYCDICDLIIG